MTRDRAIELVAWHLDRAVRAGHVNSVTLAAAAVDALLGTDTDRAGSFGVQLPDDEGGGAIPFYDLDDDRHAAEWREVLGRGVIVSRQHVEVDGPWQAVR